MVNVFPFVPDDLDAWVQQASLAIPVLPVVNVLLFVPDDLGATWCNTLCGFHVGELATLD